MSVLQNINGSLYRMDASDLVQLAAVDTEGILGGTPGATTNGQTLVDQLAADDVQAQTDIGQIKTDLSDKLDVTDYAVNGAVNHFNNTIATQTVNTVVWTKDETTKKMTANGTASGGNSTVYCNVTLEAGTWYLTGCPQINAEGDTKVAIQAYLASSPYTSYGYDTGNGLTITLDSKTTLTILPIVYSGKTVSSSSCVFDIMISNIKNAPYVPYAMTNAELTDVDTRIIIANKLFLQRCGMVKRLICRGCTYAEVKAAELPVEFRPVMKTDIPFSVMLRTVGGVYYTGVISYVESTHAFSDSVYVSAYGEYRASTPNDMQLFTSLTWI